MVAKAEIKYVRLSRRKVARLARECVNKKVGLVRAKLLVMPQRASLDLAKAINSAAANYLQRFPNYNTDDLVVDYIHVDMGPSFKRMLPKSRGSAEFVQKKTCHIRVAVKA